jgi:hypothetical protein
MTPRIRNAIVAAWLGLTGFYIVANVVAAGVMYIGGWVE